MAEFFRMLLHRHDRLENGRPSAPGFLALFRPSRNTAKAVTYAIMHLVVAMSVAFLLTWNWRAALAIGLIEPAVQTVAYYFHEKAWAKAEKRRQERLAEAS
ncbi:hypothetical protein X907_2831 [Glycocaulis alkaliphilus]|uniref:Uncharacterized protein n=1 Tax=Glycocaulis alkaliphilus TaxID=1434191 RepID=A0A3T0EDG2_9PROT|nr:DUF2061 domain-containing protein [Glycocaulis alkaliphilus]AZU05339.1 hypothetical protein X907_2831 [Glycocaulis alkaliphilus]GGB81460.1 hypothetical protein GCM10007417_21730 [Glycocaulis alkaliphilus]